ncbi:hypothetical protein BH23THE1_BH23THE1_24820 [soil metagenome]
MFQPGLKLNDMQLRCVYVKSFASYDESWCSNLLRNVRWNKGQVKCPPGHCYDIKKEGWMVSTDPITKNTFASTVKDGSMTKQAIFHYSHTFEEMVLGYLPVLHTLVWIFYEGDII